MYDYMLGGKDNYPADRRRPRTSRCSARTLVRGTVLQNGSFLGRAVGTGPREGIRQFLDVARGCPR